jgi:mannose-6-phosphate isomerase-like protein (cupin superfamily)
MEAQATQAKIVGPKDGKAGTLGSIDVRFMINGDESGGGFSLIEHPMPPRRLAAPLHKHSREDEYSFVLAGRMGALVGDEVVYGEPGDLIFKPRDQWHTFWNPGDEPASILEIISPAGFEGFFNELVDLINAEDSLDLAKLGPLGERYGVEMDPSTLPELCAEHGLEFPPAE